LCWTSRINGIAGPGHDDICSKCTMLVKLLLEVRDEDFHDVITKPAGAEKLA
jgi:hypothetical protein